MPFGLSTACAFFGAIPVQVKDNLACVQVKLAPALVERLEAVSRVEWVSRTTFTAWTWYVLCHQVECENKSTCE
jgi:hypothetical protein